MSYIVEVIELFYQIMGEEKENPTIKKTNFREAVRGVIFQDNKILLVQSNRNYYKFPGGGVEEGETHNDALIREVAEETGYVNTLIKEKLGVIIQRHIDEYDEHAYFQMTSHYYLCELKNDEKTDQQLYDYELSEEFTPQWVALGEAIKANDKFIVALEKSDWIERENSVLRKLIDAYFK
jgi:8-oxo-dGTP pyrophosphatase MutT (NUDIX family)